MPDPTILSYTIRDAEGVKAVTNVYVAYDGATLSINGLASNWDALGTKLDLITDGVIVSGRVTIPLQPNGIWKTTPTAPTQVANGAILDFNQANIKYVQDVLIPAYAQAQIVGGRPDLSLGSNTEVFISLLIATLGIFPAEPAFGNSKYLNALTSLRDAFLNTRKHRRQLDKVSFEV